MKTAIVCAMVFMLAMVGTSAWAQHHDPNDFKETDTLDMVFSVVPRAATSQFKVQMDLWVVNDSNTVGSAASGFKWINPNLRMDSARFDPVTQAAFDFFRSVYEGGNINTTNNNDRFPFVGARSFEPGMPPAPTRRIWCRYYFTVTSWTVNDSIVLDTNAYNTGVTYKFVDDGQRNYRPFWTGRKVIHDPDYVAPSTMAVSKDTLFFTGVYGQPAPPSQTFNITSTPNSIPFTVTENAPWILKSPSVGNTPATVTVSMNVTALAIGTYFDSLIVSSSGAVNSPKIVYVKLDIIPPPPVIKVTPTQLFFSAVVGGANPLPQDLIIKNLAGGSVLNWTVTNSQSWLTLAPTSGTDSNTVIASVDITGMSFGTYKDTIVVSDPAATNSPVKVPVFLQLGSNLPILVADSQVNFYVVNLNELIIFTRTFTLRNGGIGNLDFRLTTNATRIKSISPDTATAPQQITVEYKIQTAVDGQEVTDTIWATSAQAVNSPYPIIMKLRFVAQPAAIGFNPDTVRFTVYDCGMGAGNNLPVQNLLVENVGGDDPMMVHLVYSTDLFTVSFDSAEAPAFFRFTAAYPDLPVGTYYDTVLVSARNAINNPRPVIVKYDRIAGTEPPQIVANRAFWPIPYREESGPNLLSPLSINNGKGGCMPWGLQGDIPWFFPDQDTGNVPSEIHVIVNAPGYTLGTYPDTLTIAALDATNSPLNIPVELRVWRFRCDTDWDGIVDIADIVYLIAYAYFDGPIAKPTFLVGDCDCDNLVDISDITRIIDYLYMDGPVICTNPY